MYSFILSALLLLSLNVQATTFRRMPLDQLVGEATSAAEVKLISKKSYMNKIGLIFTQYTFQVSESFNLESELDGDLLKLEMTGGTVDGVTSYIDGAPEFVPGEKSFLLLKKIDNKLYLSNFTLGKYKIVQDGEEVFYVSTVFPKDPEMGKVSKEKMIEIVKEKFKISTVNSPKASETTITSAPAINKQVAIERLPAQVTSSKPAVLQLIFWSLGTIIISVIIGFLALRKEKVE